MCIASTTKDSPARTVLHASTGQAAVLSLTLEGHCVEVHHWGILDR